MRRCCDEPCLHLCRGAAVADAGAGRDQSTLKIPAAAPAASASSCSWSWSRRARSSVTRAKPASPISRSSGSSSAVPPLVNDLLLSGSADIVAAGPPAFLTLWDRTRGNADVKGVAAMTSIPMYLNTRAPHLKSIRDLKPTDRIAITA